MDFELRKTLCCIQTQLDAITAPAQLASRTFDSVDGQITVGDVTGGFAAKSLVFHLPAGQRIELTDQTAMTTAIFDNTDGAGHLTLVFSPPASLPAAWTLSAATADEALISAIF